MAPLRFVRLRPGCGPVRAQVVHLTDAEGELAPWTFENLPGTPASTSGSLRVLCGIFLVPGTYDVLSGIAGMPCESCMLNSPGPDNVPALPETRRASLPS
jgi:hypothetical protein